MWATFFAVIDYCKFSASSVNFVETMYNVGNFHFKQFIRQLYHTQLEPRASQLCILREQI